MSNANVAKKNNTLQLIERLGSGRFGNVYKAEENGQVITVKFSKKNSNLNVEDAKKNFRYESALMARMNHPGIPKVFTTSETSEGACIVMEYIEGESLDSLLKYKKFNFQDAVQFCKDLASILIEVQRHNIVHRDLKPENIIIKHDKTPTLIDFGLGENANVDNHNMTVGTLQYCSPEQSGIMSNPVDGRSDLYSLGVILFEMVVGSLPYAHSDSAELIRMHGYSELPEIKCEDSLVPEGFIKIIRKLLEKDPAKRHASAKELLIEVNELNQTFISVPSSIHEPIDCLFSRWYEKECLLLNEMLTQLRSKGSRTAIMRSLNSVGGSQYVNEYVSALKSSFHISISFQKNEQEDLLAKKIAISISKKLCALKDIERTKFIQSINKISDFNKSILINLCPQLVHIINFKITDINDAKISNHQIKIALQDLILCVLKVSACNIIVIDQIQNMSSFNLQFLKELIEKCQNHNCLFILVNEGVTGEINKANTFIDGLDKDATTTIDLHPLDFKHAKKFVQYSLGNLEATEPVLETIANKSGGSIPLIQEYISSLISYGALFPYKNSWTFDDKIVDQVELPASINDLILGRVKNLNESEMSFLNYLACVGQDIHQDIIVDKVATNGRVILAHINTLISLGIIERTPDNGIRFTSAEVHADIADKIDPTEMSAIHQLIADYYSQNIKPENQILLAYHALRGKKKNSPGTLNAVVAAGRLCLKNYSYDVAYDFMNSALSIAIDIKADNICGIYESLSDAALLTKRYNYAIDCLKSAIEHSVDPLVRARLFSKIASIYAENYLLVETEIYVNKTFEALNIELPSPSLLSVLKTLYIWLKAKILLLYPTKMRLVATNNIEELSITAQMYHLLVWVYWFRIESVNLTKGTLVNIQIYLRALLPAVLLGDRYEALLSKLDFALLVITVRKYRLANKITSEVNALAAKLGDLKSKAVSTFMIIGAKTIQGLDYESDALTESWFDKYSACAELRDVALCLTGYLTSMQIRGRCNRGIDFLNEVLCKVQTYDCDQRMLHYLHFQSYQAGAVLHAMQGHVTEALDHRKRADTADLDVLANKAIFYTHKLHYLLEMGDYGLEAETIVQKYKDLKISNFVAMYHLSRIYALAAYLHLYRSMDSQYSGDKEKNIQELKNAIKEAQFLCKFHNLKPHIILLKGSLLRLKANYIKSESLLYAVLKMSLDTDAPILQFEAYRQLALLYRDTSQEQKSNYAIQSAIHIAEAQGYKPRLKWIAKNFEFSEASDSSFVTSAKYTTNKTSYFNNSNQNSRLLTTLLKVNGVTAKFLSPDLQIRAVLDETVKVLNAERIFLFLFDNKKLQHFGNVGRDSEGHDIENHVGYSATVIDRVYSTGETFVISGTNSNIVEDSKSVVLNDLRSIIASPVKLHGEMIGVIYLDSRLAKGIFNEDDTELLEALSGHIGVALERADSLDIALTKKSLEKDLELAAAVQKLLLPKNSSITYDDSHALVYYKSSARIGGDWWWSEYARSKSRFLIGDVTGHGVGPAMVTAVVASCYRTINNLDLDLNLDKTARQLNAAIRNICDGQYWMSMSLIEWDAKSKILLWSTAASPGIFVLPREGTSYLLSEVGTPLGMDEFDPNVLKLQLTGNERLLIFTDGIFEERCKNGRALGCNKLQNIFNCTHKLNLEEAYRYIIKNLNEQYESENNSDDMTFMLIDLISVTID